MTAQGNRVLHIVLVTALALAGCDSKDSSSVTQDTGLAIGQAEYVGSGQVCRLSRQGVATVAGLSPSVGYGGAYRSHCAW